ncbi:MAG TPA: hypothetical protein VMU45_00720 [Candidatus Eisenbacteria bacterium]|nr:hypothetical protein [Candidatus Eisenbacteria bacterium]
MNLQRKFVTLLLLLALLLTEACNKKKPTLPAQAPAPTVAEALPDEIPENPDVPSTEIAQAPAATPAPNSKPKKPVRTPKKKPTVASAPATAASNSSPPAPVATPNNQTVATLRPPKNPTTDSAPDLAIAAAIPSQQISQQKEETTRIVDATENALKGIHRSLSDDEKAMRTQIQSYLQQSRKATSDGDYERAYNLAKKAQLLAEALIKK